MEQRTTVRNLPVVLEVIEPSCRPDERRARTCACIGEPDAILGNTKLHALDWRARRCCNLTIAHRLGNEKIAATGNRPDDPVRVVPERPPDILDTLDQRVISHEQAWPDCFDQLVLRNRTASVLDQIAKDVERLRPQLQFVRTAM